MARSKKNENIDTKVAKKTTKKIVKESIEESVKEPIKEPKESIEESVKEPIKEPVKDSVKESVIEGKLTNENIYNLESEPNIFIDLSKAIRYNVTTIEGKVINDPQYIYYGIPYGSNLEDIDILTHNEMQTLLNSQMVQNHIKLHRLKMKEPNGEEGMLNSDDITIISKVKAYRAIIDKLKSLKTNS